MLRDSEWYVWEAEYWSDYLADFGPVAYVEARYLEARDVWSE